MFCEPLSHKFCTETVQNFEKLFPFAHFDTVGMSLEGREIRLLRLGNGPLKYLIVGAHHGAEWITGLVSLHIFEVACQKLLKNGLIGGIFAENYFEKVSLYIIPVLNPDGVELAVSGVSRETLLAERQIRMNGGSTDFSRWQANARGVDLNRNYNADWARGKALAGVDFGAPTRFGGQFPESEPETRALCELCVRENFGLAVALHSQGREIYCDYNGKEPPISAPMALRLAQLTGYKVAKPEKIASCAGFKDWFIEQFGKPALTIECGQGENPLPLESFAQISRELTEPLLSLPLFAKLA